MEFKRKKVIELYLAGKSQRKIVSELKDLKLNKMFVHRTIKRYNETGSIAKRFGGGRKSETTDEMIRQVKDRLQQDPNCSARKMSAELGIPRQRVQNILKNDLGLTAQKFQEIKDFTPIQQNKVRSTRIKEVTPEYLKSKESTSSTA